MFSIQVNKSPKPDDYEMDSFIDAWSAVEEDVTQ